MGNPTLLDKFKKLLYIIILPIYLWSINMKSLEDYEEMTYELGKIERENQ
jgi:hypothetical protein